MVNVLDNTLYNAIVTAIVSAIITNVCLWWHKKADYKRDYYKKIIDKRMNAYEKLQNYVMKLAVSKQILDVHTSKISESNKNIYECFCKESDIDKALCDTIEIASYSPWFSYEIIDGLYSINKILAEAKTVILYPTTENLQIYKFDETALGKDFLSIDIGVKVYDDMHQNIAMIKTAILRDIGHLDDVEGFLKMKNL